MIDIMLVPLQFLILSLLITEHDVIYICRGLALLFLVNCIIYFFGFMDYYYIRHSINDIITSCLVFKITCKIKQSILFIISFCSLFMNIYEHFSYYQTFIYPYRDVIQWWMVEAIFITLAWKCGWRYNVKLRRVSN